MKTLRKLSSLVLTCFVLSSCYSGKTWRTASRQSAGMAPGPSVTKEAVLQVYGADTWGWRGWFAIHTWIAAKRTGEANYTVYDVVGWRGYRGQPVMRITQDIPDRYWFGEKPRLIKEHRGKGVDDLMIRRLMRIPGKRPTRPFQVPTATPSLPGSLSRCQSWS